MAWPEASGLPATTVLSLIESQRLDQSDHFVRHTNTRETISLKVGSKMFPTVTREDVMIQTLDLVRWSRIAQYINIALGAAAV
ncbi:hypothetical protein BS47DRAFT_1393249 [Hydnum rufescens UP504]|uniref:Uncharacterized protein n=1 Tax=Hydnum rufescens UP504 TaxID=1448309 RepID=A0A9P6DWC2_9AGAM|nr:hypothetical protein BS47DRAFT_1393249 [Hydnum rufescens UP504]